MKLLKPESATGKDHPGHLNLLLLFSLVVLTICIALLAAVPPVSRDALTHHLFVPRLYLEHGGIYEIPDIPFSYYPMNLDLLYMIPLYFGNDILPKYIHFAFALATAGLVYSYLKKRLSSIYGLLGALFFISTPIIVKLSITAYVDLGLMFFTTASLLVLFGWLNSGYRIWYLLLAAICCGLAAGTKYNGLISLFLLPLFIPILYLRSQPLKKGGSGRAIAFTAFFITIALITFSPWLLRNYMWTGNPIYPLYESLFHHDKPVSSNESPARAEQQATISEKFRKLSTSKSSIFVARKILYHETWWQTLLLPVRFFFEGQDDNPQYFDGKLNPFLFILPFFAFLKKANHRLQREKYALLAFAFLFFFFTFFQETLRIRYIVSIIPALVLLSIFGLNNIIEYYYQNLSSHNIIMRYILPVSVIIVMFVYNIIYVSGQFQIVKPFSYLVGQVDRNQYIEKFRPEYPVIQFANTHTQKSTKVLCLFLGNRGYYMKFHPVFKRPAKDLVFDSISAKGENNTLRAEFLRRKIAYVLLRNDLTTNWFQHLDAQEKKKIEVFFSQHTNLLYSRNGYSFFKLR